MLHSYVKTAVRSLLKRKGQTAIGIAGLTVGLLGCLMIFVWVRGELSYDRFHENADRTFRIITSRGMLFPCAMGPHITDNFPEVEYTARIHHRWWQLGYENKSFMGQVECVDPTFLNMFSFELIRGDRQTVISSAQSIAITETTAERIFGDEDPIGKTLLVHGGEPLTVSGILRDPPFNSHLQFDGLVNLQVMRSVHSWYPPDDSWTDGDLWIYMLVRSDADLVLLRDKLQRLVDERFPNAGVDVINQPITEIHLQSGQAGGSAMTHVYIFIGVAALILLSACINYINLSTARAGDRAREVGIRKAVGAGRSSLVWQFMGESVLIALIAALAAMGLAELLRPWFSTLVGREVPFTFGGDPVLLIGALCIIVVTGLMAGVYPSLVLSSFRPVKVFRSAGVGRARGSNMRRLLVVGQFVVSVFLLIGVAVVYGQLDFVTHKNLGYDRESILHLPLAGRIYEHYGPIMDDLDNIASVQSYTFTNTMLNRAETSTDEVSWEGQKEGDKMYVRVQAAGYSFADVFGIEMAQGRFFSRDFATDLEEGYILNETAVALMGLESPIGKEFSCMGQEGTIVGVVKDYNYRSLHYEIQPLVLAMRPAWSDNLAIRVDPRNVAATAHNINAVVKKHAPDYPIEVEFFENELDELYKSERQVAEILTIASGLAVFMSCLGILGLVSHAVRRRTKEIGVRKIFGASVPNLVRLISWEFIAAMCLAYAIAWPLAYYASTRWLEDFAFSVPVSWPFLVLPSLLTMLAAMLTAGYHAFRAARANPAQSLRYE